MTIELLETAAFLLSQVIIFILMILHCIFKLFFSDEFKAPRFYFNFFVYYFALFLTTLLYLPLLAIRPKRPENTYLFLNVFEYLGMNIIGIELEIRNSKVLAKDRGAIVVENHQSSLEVLLLFQIWRRVVKTVIGVSKKELLWMFPYGPATWLSGTMYIDRSNRDKAYESLNEIGKVVTATKGKAWIHPEGTRNHNKGTMLPFKRGAFHMAVTAQVPIIPIAISPYYFIDYKSPSFEKPRVIMQVLEEIETTGLTENDVPELMERVRLQIWEAYKKLYSEVMSHHAHLDKGAYELPGSVDLK